MKIEKLRESIEGEQNPALVATEIGLFTSRSLKSKNLSLYEALYLKELEYSLLLQASEKAAWSYKIGISLLLSLELLYSLALYYEEDNLANSIKNKISVALGNNIESRHHYSKVVAKKILAGNVESAFLALSSSRKRAKTFDGGPFNDEVFPWDIIAPEKELLSGKHGNIESISPAISDLLSDIWVSYG